VSGNYARINYFTAIGVIYHAISRSVLFVIAHSALLGIKDINWALCFAWLMSYPGTPVKF
jgi:hypothetical protein